jgi:hypothetical protein
MQKLILGSVLFISLFVPIAAARAASPGFALRRAVWWMLAAIGLYALAVTLVYPRLVST